MVRKLHIAVGQDAQIRYLLGAQTGDPGEPAKSKSFADGVIRPVHLGLRIRGNHGVGTLGPFVELSNGEPGFITAGHVLEQKTGELQFQSPVTQSGSSGDSTGGDVIGFVVYLNRELDACTLRLRYGIQFLGNVVPVGYEFPYEGETIKAMASPEEFAPNLSIFELGSGSGIESGKISAFAVDGVEIQTPSGMRIFDDLIEISSPSEEPFSHPGDSGAMVYTRIKDQLFCLGIHFAGGMLQIDGRAHARGSGPSKCCVQNRNIGVGSHPSRMIG